MGACSHFQNYAAGLGLIPRSSAAQAGDQKASVSRALLWGLIPLISIDGFLDAKIAYVVLAIIALVSMVFVVLFWTNCLKTPSESAELKLLELQESIKPIKCSKEEHENVVFCFSYALLVSIGIVLNTIFIGLENPIAITIGTVITSAVAVFFIRTYSSRLVKANIVEIEKRSDLAISKILKLSVGLQSVFVVLSVAGNILIAIYQSDFSRMTAFFIMVMGVIISLFCSLAPLSKLAQRMEKHLDNEKNVEK